MTAVKFKQMALNFLQIQMKMTLITVTFNRALRAQLQLKIHEFAVKNLCNYR